MFYFISNTQLERIIKMVNKLWKEQIEPLVQTIAKNTAESQETKDAVAALKVKVEENTAGDTALQTRVDDLETAAQDIQTVISEIVTKLQAGDTAGALEAAQKAQENAVGTPDGKTE